MVNREVSKVKQSITPKVAIREILSLVGYYRKFILRRGLTLLGYVFGARDQVNLHPESESGVKKHPSSTKIF